MNVTLKMMPATLVDILENNKPPKFVTDPIDPLPIPCEDSDLFETYKY